jgi:hypothetical protein
LFLHTLAYPLSFVLSGGIIRRVFAPQPVPDGYIKRAAIRLVLRPKTFLANARDLALLKDFVAGQVPSYGDLRSPTIIMTGDRDSMVSPKTNAYALAAALPAARLILLKGVGHMPHYAAPQPIAAAIDEIARADCAPPKTATAARNDRDSALNSPGFGPLLPWPEAASRQPFGASEKAIVAERPSEEPQREAQPR